MPSLAISHRQIYLLWCLAWFLLIVLLIQPISYAIMRAAIVMLIATIWVGIGYLWWRRVAVRVGLLTISILVALCLILPSRPTEIESLRSAYVRSLDSYLGTTYVWGGENRLGIDCSGLVRQGLIEANLQQGIATLNPALVKQGFLMWWFDLSALSLRDGARGWTQQLFRSPDINAIDSAKLLAGDLAVTIDGQHILAYVGANRWIEADPGALKTIAVMVPNLDNFWFQVPVYVLRWQQLALVSAS